jgi:hypothetical protein
VDQGDWEMVGGAVDLPAPLGVMISPNHTLNQKRKKIKHRAPMQ